MTNRLNCTVKNNPYEQNFDDCIQGVFRKTMLDLDLLIYAVEQDIGIRRNRCNLVITCLDLMKDYVLVHEGEIHGFNAESAFINYISDVMSIATNTSMMEVYLSRSPFAHEMEKFK